MVTQLLRSRPAGAAAPAAGAGWTKRDGALEEFVPRYALDGILVNTGVAWTWSPYVELTAGLDDPFIPHIVHASFRVAPLIGAALYPVVEVEIATGPVDSEALYARFSDAYGAFIWPADAIALMGTSKSWPCGPNPIAADTRISARTRCSLADTQVELVTCLYLGGYDNAAPAAYAQPNLDDYLDGDNAACLLSTPSGSLITLRSAAWGTWTSWVTIIDPAPQDLLLWGTTYSSREIANISHYLEFATGPASGEVPRGRLAVPGNGAGANCGVQRMRRPVFVQSGERLAFRTQGAQLVTNYQFLYSEV